LSFINKNCFIDESIFKIEENIIKEEKGIYVTALKQKKRIHLCKDINEINLIANYSQEPEQHINLNGINIINKEFIKKHDLYKYYNKALFGCIFSIQDCSSNVSCEYLLSGLPVLTTRSSGGRNIWYNKYNHILIEPNQNSLKEAISLCKEKIEKGIFNSELIRRKQLKLMLDFRFKFNKLISQISNLNLEECIEKFNEKFFIFQ
jgi:glycosyltransferase involved in cell wall biosynthesis